MKCPNCGQWNRASLPHCFHCGQPLEPSYGPSGASEPAWRAELKDKDKSKSYIRVDEAGEVENAADPRDLLAGEMVDLKTRKLQGEVQQRRLRASAAQRGLAPSGRTVRTTSNRGTFFSSYDDPDTTLRPVPPELVEEGGEVEHDARRVYNTERQPNRGGSRPEDNRGYGNTQRILHGVENGEEQSVYDGYYDTSAYLPSQSRQDEYEHSLRMRPASEWKPRRFGLRRLIRILIIVASLSVAGWLAWTVVIPMFTHSNDDLAKQVSVIPTIRNDLAAHTVTIPGADGQRISIRELRTSAIVTGGIATFDIADHIWYDEYEDYLQDSMTVTLTPFLITETGKQQPLPAIHYDIDIPLSPIQLETPDNPYKTVSTAMYSIVFYVREGSTVTINGEDYSDLVNTEGGKVSYNATVQPIGENNYTIVVRSQYCRENSMTVTLYREKQDIPLDLASDIASRSTDKTLTIRATTLPGAVVRVLTPYQDLDITNSDTDGSFAFKAVFEHIGDNTITITADYPGKKTTTVEHTVYYVPSANEYTRKALDIVTQYTNLMDNMDVQKKQSRIYLMKGVITSIETTKPQRAYMECTTAAGTVTVYIENMSRTTWVEGERYALFGDAYGMYNSKPWLVVRYTYGFDEVS